MEVGGGEGEVTRREWRNGRHGGMRTQRDDREKA